MGNKKKVQDLLNAEARDQVIAELSFEEGLLLLEELVGQVESGSLPLQQAIFAYERGVGLVDHLRTMLNAAEEKLKILQQDKKSSQ